MLAKIAAVFRRLEHVWRYRSLSLNTKLQLYSAVVVIYASETWKNAAGTENKLDTFHQRNLRQILRVTWKNKITNAAILTRTNQRWLQDIVAERRLRFARHVIRMAPERPTRNTMDWIPTGGKRGRGRQSKTWSSTLKDDLHRSGTTWDEAKVLAADRSEFLLILTSRCGPTSHDWCRPVFRSCISSAQFAVECQDQWSSRWLHFLFLVIWTTRCDTCRHPPTPSAVAPVCYEWYSSSRYGHITPYICGVMFSSSSQLIVRRTTRSTLGDRYFVVAGVHTSGTT